MTTHDQAHERARKAVDAWITKGDAKAERQLRAALHALAACQGTRRELREKPGRPKRRKAAAARVGSHPAGHHPDSGRGAREQTLAQLV